MGQDYWRLLETARHQKGLLETSRDYQETAKDWKSLPKTEEDIITLHCYNDGYGKQISRSKRNADPASLTSLHKPVGMVLFPVDVCIES